MQQKDYYSILGVSETATTEEIKRKYRKLAKEFHPDHRPGDAAAETRFKEVSEAYEILGDAAKRKKYDELRRYGSGQARPSMSWEDFSGRFGGYDTGDAQEFTWGFEGDSLRDIFSSLFGGSARGTRSARSTRRGTSQHRRSAAPEQTSDPFFKRQGNDAYVDISVNLAQLLLGSKVRVRTPNGGRVNVRIAEGTQPGATLRVPGQGFAGHMGNGDLYLRLHLSIPTTLTAEQQQSAREFAQRMGMRY